MYTNSEQVDKDQVNTSTCSPGAFIRQRDKVEFRGLFNKGKHSNKRDFCFFVYQSYLSCLNATQNV